MNRFSFRKFSIAMFIAALFLATIYYLDSTNYFLRATIIVEEDEGSETQESDVNGAEQIREAGKNLEKRKKVLKDMEEKLKQLQIEEIQELQDFFEGNE